MTKKITVVRTQLGDAVYAQALMKGVWQELTCQTVIQSDPVVREEKTTEVVLGLAMRHGIGKVKYIDLTS